MLLTKIVLIFNKITFQTYTTGLLDVIYINDIRPKNLDLLSNLEVEQLVYLIKITYLNKALISKPGFIFLKSRYV